MLSVPIKMNLQETCRLCLGQGGVLSPIFPQSVGGGEGCRQSAPQPQPTLPLRIMACAPIKVIEGDHLPAQICHRCLYQVERSYDFKEQCESSDKILRQYVAQMLNESKADEQLHSTFLSNLSTKEKDGKELDTQPEKPQVAECDQSKFPKPSDEDTQREVKVTILQSKLSALIHQSTVIPSEEDVDSGLLESLADSDDLQVIGSESENMNVGENEGPKFDKSEDDVSDRSESSEDEARLRCKMCKETFPDVEILVAHEVSHEASGPPYPCSICDKVFSDKGDLDTHWLVHNCENPLQCPLCEASFINEDLLGDHLPSHNVNLPYCCLTCDKSFVSRIDLLKHTKAHRDLSSFKCKLYPKEIVRGTSFSKHFRVHNGQKPFYCTDCPKMFRTKGDLHRHEIIHTGQKPFTCSLCNLSFNRKDKLFRHERLHATEKMFANHAYAKIDIVKLYSDPDQPVQEEATDLSMPSKKGTLVEHHSEGTELNEDDSTMDTEPDNQLQICEDPVDEGISDGHSSDKVEGNSEKQGVESMVINVDPFQMERMDVGFKESDLPSNFSLSSIKSEFEKEEFSPNENEVEEHIQGNTKPYACEFCPKKFADKSYMKTHQLTHLGIRPHACSYCGKGFFRRRELLRHETVHTGIKPFSCKTCNKAFARSDKLMRHERTHGEPKNFSCPLCPAVFSRKDELSRHGMCHTGERPHCCSQCFKSFFSRAELTRHEKTHAGLKPFKCDHCDQCFLRRDKLNRHIRTHISSVPPKADTNVIGTVQLHDLLAVHCGQHFAAEVRVKDEKMENGEDLKVRIDGAMDARALARLNQNPDIHLIPLKQN